MNPLNCTGTIHGLPALLVVAIFGFVGWQFLKMKDVVIKVIGMIIVAAVLCAAVGIDPPKYAMPLVGLTYHEPPQGVHCGGNTR